MTDNKELRQQIEPLLNEMLLTLTAFYDANALQSGIKYCASIGDRAFSIHFQREERLDGQPTISAHMAENTAVGLEKTNG